MKTRLHRRGPNPRPQAAHGNSWTKGQLAEWGIAWPPPTGWRAELEERWFREHPEERKRPVRVVRFKPPRRFRQLCSDTRAGLVDQFGRLGEIAEQLDGDNPDLEDLFDDIADACLRASEVKTLAYSVEMLDHCERHLDDFRPRDRGFLHTMRLQAQQGKSPSPLQASWLNNLYAQVGGPPIHPLA